MDCAIRVTPVVGTGGYGRTVSCACGLESPMTLSGSAVKDTIIGHLKERGVIVFEQES